MKNMKKYVYEEVCIIVSVYVYEEVWYEEVCISACLEQGLRYDDGPTLVNDLINSAL